LEPPHQLFELVGVGFGLDDRGGDGVGSRWVSVSATMTAFPFWLPRDLVCCAGAQPAGRSLLERTKDPHRTPIHVRSRMSRSLPRQERAAVKFRFGTGQ
jgi:hypothetical protein